MLAYQLELTPDDNGTFLVTCPLLPEVTTFGESRAEAVAQGGHAIEEALAARISDGRDLPVPHRGQGLKTDPETGLVRLPLLTALKALLYVRLRRSGVTRAELARRLGWHREQVDRLFRLDHKSQVDQLEAAFQALGSSVEVAIKEAA
jgi:antitoxin HicB